MAQSCALRSLEAATISMALVICLVDCMLRIRVLMSFMDTPAMLARLLPYFFPTNSAVYVSSACLSSCSFSSLSWPVVRMAVSTS